MVCGGDQTRLTLYPTTHQQSSPPSPNTDNPRRETQSWDCCSPSSRSRSLPVMHRFLIQMSLLAGSSPWTCHRRSLRRGLCRWAGGPSIAGESESVWGRKRRRWSMPDVSSKNQIWAHFIYSHYGFECHTSEVHWSLLLVADDMVRDAILDCAIHKVGVVTLYYAWVKWICVVSWFIL